ncbi:MAG TPA: aldo/keto reductase [Gemmatimonadales bacterium]
MEMRRIGSLEVTVVGIGCNNFGGRVDQAGTTAVVDAALGAGINFFDTADIYGGTKSEEFLGKALGKRRAEVVIASKFGMEVGPGKKGARPDYLRRALDDSLRRLGTDRIDLYQQHQWDPEVPIAETLGALNEAVQAGKVREIGCSNFSVAQLREVHAAAVPGAARFVSVQNEYSLLHREPEKEVLAECGRLKLAFIPFYPLAAGLLTGKYRKGRPAPEGSRLAGGRYASRMGDGTLDTVESLRTFAAARGCSLLELAVTWLATRPAVASVIAGATKPEQAKANAAAVGAKFTTSELAEIGRIAAGEV